MKTLTPEQRIEGFSKLENENGRAHLASFLAGIAHAEKVLASEEQDQPEPVAWMEYTPDGKEWFLAYSRNLGAKQEPLYLHPAPQRSFVRLSEETVRWEYEKTKKNLRTVALTEYGWFDAGVRFAEKDYGIGGENE
jgi:hypothetical protein